MTTQEAKDFITQAAVAIHGGVVTQPAWTEQERGIWFCCLETSIGVIGFNGDSGDELQALKTIVQDLTIQLPPGDLKTAGQTLLQ